MVTNIVKTTVTTAYKDTKTLQVTTSNTTKEAAIPTAIAINVPCVKTYILSISVIRFSMKQSGKKRPKILAKFQQPRLRCFRRNIKIIVVVFSQERLIDLLNMSISLCICNLLRVSQYVKRSINETEAGSQVIIKSYILLAQKRKESRKLVITDNLLAYLLPSVIIIYEFVSQLGILSKKSRNLKKKTIMKKAKCECPVATETTTGSHYQQHSKLKPINLGKPNPPNDQELISQYDRNNLRVNGKMIKPKTWPHILDNAEEYKDFLKRLECCKKKIFEKYFQDPPIQPEVIEEMLRKQTKSTYQLVYSPDEFMPRKESRRVAKLADYPTNMKYELTTYRTYFNRVTEMDRFKDIFYKVERKQENKNILKNDLRRIHRCGRTTYLDQLATPGKIYAKPTAPGPIDRYTLRRI
uniref:Uncharacterized protein n=1 Tax=Glossina austeni TaxID=7395 RepID=A0A1A9VIY5_GLOAU